MGDVVAEVDAVGLVMARRAPGCRAIRTPGRGELWPVVRCPACGCLAARQDVAVGVTAYHHRTEFRRGEGGDVVPHPVEVCWGPA